MTLYDVAEQLREIATVLPNKPSNSNGCRLKVEKLIKEIEIMIIDKELNDAKLRELSMEGYRVVQICGGEASDYERRYMSPLAKC